jgi:hypothetical protein
MKRKYAAAFIGLLLLVFVVSATTSYVTQGMGETDNGPDGVLVPLGIPVQYLYIYTWISLLCLCFIGGSAAQRNSEFWAFILCIFAAMFVWWGWLVMPFAQGVGIIIICGVLALAVYMKGKQQEKFGIAGPGSPFLNIVFWMIIIQASIGFVDAAGLFSAYGSNTSPVPTQFQNIQLSTDVPQIAQTGGFFTTLTSDAFLLGTMAWSAMTMIWKVLYDIIYFKALCLSIAPFLANNTTVDSFLNILTVGIDFIITIAVWMWLFKPPMTETV